MIYAYHLTADGIAGYVWGKLNYKTAKKLRGKLKPMGIAYDTVYTDKVYSFTAVFQKDNHIIGKGNTQGI